MMLSDSNIILSICNNCFKGRNTLTTVSLKLLTLYHSGYRCPGQDKSGAPVRDVGLFVPVCELGWAEEPGGGGAFVCSRLGWQEQRVLQ